MSNVSEKEFKALITLLDDNDNEVFTHVSDKLFSLGLEGIPMLESAWETSDNQLTQHRLENLINKIQFSNVKDRLSKWIETGGSDLLEGALIVARFQYPELDELKITQKIQAISKNIWIELNPALSPLEEAHVINHVFFQLHGFFGKQSQQIETEISYINKLLETKRGNSISLSILYLILAQKNDLPIYGVNLPCHFIMAYSKKHLSEDELTQNNQERNVMFYINPLNKGIAFSRSEISHYLEQMKYKSHPCFYSPCNNLEIIKTLINDLICNYQQLKQLEKETQLIELFNLFNIESPEIDEEDLF
ncbi:MAG: transglutaminase-like domain-containing protein [Chitinophagales bacterium]|nr:transglutaminase family protein [Bacteroidota bacterium]